MKLALPPDQSSYTFEDGLRVASTKLEGGALAVRKDYAQASALVHATWTVGPDLYRYLRAFYHVCEYGALPFDVDLILDTNSLATYRAHFVPETFMLRSVDGQKYVVQADLDVILPWRS